MNNKLFEDDVNYALHRSDGSVVPGSGLNSFDDKDFADFSASYPGSFPGSLPQNAILGLNGDARQGFRSGYDVPLLSPYDIASIMPIEDGILDFDFSIASAGTLLGMASPVLKGRDESSPNQKPSTTLPFRTPSPYLHANYESSTKAEDVKDAAAGNRATSGPSKSGITELFRRAGLGASQEYFAGSSSSSSSCQCMHTALGILDTLESARSTLSLEQIDQILGFKKAALAQCHEILECSNCNKQSRFTMPLVVICEQMAASFERIVRCFQELHEEGPKGTMLSTGAKPRMVMGAYEVDEAEEQWPLMRRLTILQAQKFGLLQNRLKEIAIQHTWDVHLAMLDSVERRIREILVTLRRLDVEASP